MKIHLRYETAGLVAVTRSMDIAVAYVIQVFIHIQTLIGFIYDADSSCT